MQVHFATISCWLIKSNLHITIAIHAQITKILGKKILKRRKMFMMCVYQPKKCPFSDNSVLADPLLYPFPGYPISPLLSKSGIVW